MKEGPGPLSTTTWSEKIKSRKKKEVVTANPRSKKGRFSHRGMDIRADNRKLTHCPPQCPYHCSVFRSLSRGHYKTQKVHDKKSICRVWQMDEE